MAKIADENNPSLDGFRWTDKDRADFFEDVLHPRPGETPRQQAHRQIDEALEIAIKNNNRALNNPEAANIAAWDAARTKHNEIEASNPPGKKGNEWFDKPYHGAAPAQRSSDQDHANGGVVHSGHGSSHDENTKDLVRGVEAELRTVGLDPGPQKHGREDGVCGPRANAGIEKVIIWAQMKSGEMISGDYTAETSRALHGLNPRLADALDKLKASGQMDQLYGPKDVEKIAKEIRKNSPDFSMAAVPLQAPAGSHPMSGAVAPERSTAGGRPPQSKV